MLAVFLRVQHRKHALVVAEALAARREASKIKQNPEI